MPDWKLWLVTPLLCAWPLGALADDNEIAKLVVECGAEDLPQASLDSCLERVRVLEETDPSAQLQSLEGQLQRRELGRAKNARTEANSAPPSDIPAQGAAPPAPEDDGYATEIRSRDSSPTLSGAQADDQPPVADPPDSTPEDRSDEADNPE